MKLFSCLLFVGLLLASPGSTLWAQPDRPPPPGGPERGGGQPGGRGFGGGPGQGGGPGFSRPTRELVGEFDQNEDGWLDLDERTAARELLAAEAEAAPEGGRGRGGPRRGGQRLPPAPGVNISPDDVTSYPDAGLYDSTLLRTIFLEFENADWESELETFHNTDVEVPATLIVDGRRYENVGVRFRGASSYGFVPTGYKRSFNVSMDLADEDQRLYGYKTLNLLNSNGDPSYMSTVLYSEVARQYMVAPQSNHVQVVVNGENWGVYVNVQQFDKIFLEESYGSSRGTRWKVSGSPRGDGGLRYMGDDIAAYESRYEMKSNDGEKAWRALIELCRVLNETPLEELEAALEPILDIDETLWFLALDVALVNSDGYWTRASDYSIFRDQEGIFHVIPHDMNEAFRDPRVRGGGGPGGGRGGGRGGEARPSGGAPERGDPDAPRQGRGDAAPETSRPQLDPLVAIDNPRMPLRSRLLAVPHLRERYLEYLRVIAGDALALERVAPVIDRHLELIKEPVRRDTKKLSSFENFLKAMLLDDDGEPVPGSLHDFITARSAYLLDFVPPDAGDSERQ